MIKQLDGTSIMTLARLKRSTWNTRSRRLSKQPAIYQVHAKFQSIEMDDEDSKQV